MTGEERLEQLYAKLPEIDCTGECWAECTTVPCSPVEMLRAMGLRPSPPQLQGGVFCPYLDLNTKRCTIHSIRPMVCRLWGVWERFPCPHGCKPKGPYIGAEEGDKMLYEALQIGKDT